MKDKFSRFLLSSSAILSFCYVLPAAASEQAADQAVPQGTYPGGEIVVTAQRREQKLQDVGIAVSAETGLQLRSQNITASADISRIAPSLNVTSFSSAAVIFNIRGISQNDYGDQQEPPVAVYQDDSYASSLVLAGFPIFDLARVEVLRGPQGTLFGRNATGGAVQFVSNQPTDYLDGFFKTSYASFGAFKAEGAVSGPLADGLTVRLAGQTSQGGNYLKAADPSAIDLGGDNNYALRSIVKWEASPDLTASLMLRYLRGDHERNAGVYSLDPACPNDHLQGEYLPAGQTCAFWGVSSDSTGGGYSNNAINPQRGGNPYRNAMNVHPFIDRKIFGSQLRLNAKLGGIDLISITDYQHARKYYVEDSDGSPVDLVNYQAGMKFDQLSQEVRTSYDSGNNLLVLGAMGMYMNGRYTASFSQPVFDYFPDVRFTVKTTSFAFFGQDEFQITDKVKLIGGLRYWRDTRKLDYVATESSSDMYLQLNQSSLVYRLNGSDEPLPGLTITPDDARKSFSGITGRASIEYKPSSDLLIYASYNRGSKSGGFTISSGTPLPSGVVDTFNNIVYRAEKIDSVEAGFKARLMPGTTFNVTAYKYWYHDYQAFIQLGLIQTIRNLPAGAYGLEAELATTPMNGLTLKASASLINSHVNDVALPDGVTIERHRLPQVAKFGGTLSGRYEFDLGPGKASIQADMQYKGKFCYTVLCAPVDEEGAYALVNMSAGYDFSRFGIRVFVDNLTKTQYRTWAADGATYAGSVVSTYGRPRTFGASLEYRFK